MSAEIISPENNIELLSDEIREIVSYRPGWIVRKVNPVFFFYPVPVIYAHFYY